MRKSFLYFPFYVFLFPVFLVISLYSNNVSEVETEVIVRPILVLLLLTLLLFLMLFWISRNSQKSALASFTILLSLLYYGQAYQYLKAHLLFGFNFGRHSILGSLWLILTIIILLVIFAKGTKVNRNLSFFLNIALSFLLISTGISTISRRTAFVPPSADSAVSSEVKAQDQWIAQVEQPLNSQTAQALPDIYYIIPDMFARADVIQEETGLDSSSFTAALSQMGFYVADCSRSNYASTQLSITSALNMQYLDKIQTGLTDRGQLVEPMSNSLLRASLKSLGYTTVVFDNGFGLAEISDADVTLMPDKRPLLLRPYNPFENLIVGNSFLRVFYDVKLGFLSRLYDRVFFPYWEHVDAQKFILDKLPNLQEIQGPKFVFAHLMMPHPPYLIHADGTIETDSRYYREALGQPVTEELYLQGYRMQVEYLEDRLPEIVDQIISASAVPPVIIIQGDHGIRYTNRLDNFSAYYVPESVRANLYPAITSVNTFRLVLNGLFGTNYELLRDESYYSLYPEWFELQLDPEQNPACIQPK